MIAGTLEIQLLANMARLQKDMDQAKRTVSGTVDAMNRVLGTIGVGVSLAGIASMIKSVVDTGDKLNDLRKITGLTVNELGGLDKQAKLNGTNLDSVARAIGVMSKNMYTGIDAFKLLGIATKDADGNLRNTNQVLLEVSDRFSRMQDGAQKAALANQIFGKSGRELIPLLNEGRGSLESAIESHRKYSGVTQASAEASDLFNDNLALLSGRVAAIKTSFVGELLPTLNAISSAMLNSGQSTSQFSFAASVVVPILKSLAIAGGAVVGIFQGVGREIGAAAAQMMAMARFDFNGVAVISKALAQDHKNADAAFNKYVDTILNSDKVVQQANVSQQKMLDIQVQMPAATDAATKAIEKQTKAYDIEIYKLKQYEDLYKKGRDLTASVATDQERYNQKLEELNQLKPYVTIETYNRALEKAQKELKGTEAQTRQTTDEVSQLWMQAGRNIQSTLANSIFNFFDDGLKGMVQNVASTVGRILSEFAALKLAQSIGLASMFGGVSGVANAAGSVSNGGSILSSAANLGSNALGLVRGGFGLSGLLSGGSAGVFSNLGGAGTAFIGGPGTALGGSGLGGASTLGATFGGAFAGIGAGFAGGSLIAGDKKLGPLSGNSSAAIGTAIGFAAGGPIGAVIGGLIGGLTNALFGRGPYKFRQQSLQGDFSSSGFDGEFTNVFRAKGGLLRSNGHRSVEEELSAKQQKLFDDTVTGLYDSSRKFAVNLGLSTSLVDTFTKEIQIKSEKGKTLTEEAITEMFAGFADSLAANVIPGIEEFGKGSERLFETFERLNSEFSVLTDAAALLFDKSSGWAQDFVKQFGFGQRSDFLTQAGGADAFAANVAGFAQNFLTDDQRMRPVIASILSERDKLGLGGINTREQFTGAVQSGKLNVEQMLFLLQNQSTIKTIFDYLDSKNGTTEAAIKAIEEIKYQAIDLNVISGNFNTEINRVTSNIERLKDFSQELAAAVLQIQPMTRSEAFQKLIAYTTAAANGGSLNIEDIRAPINTLSNFNNNDYSSSLALARDRSRSASTINSLISISSGKQSDLGQQIIDLKNTMVAVMQDIANSSRQTSEILDSVSAGGGPLLTTTA